VKKLKFLLAVMHSFVLVCAAQTHEVSSLRAVDKIDAASHAHVTSLVSRSNLVSRGGGLIVQPRKVGSIVLFLDTQTRVPEGAFASVPNDLQKILRLPVAVITRPSAKPVADAIKALTDTNTVSVIVLGDDPVYPALLVAPENRWAMVNVAALGGANVSANTLAERVTKETWRAFGYLMGAADSTYEKCLMKSIFSPEELDALVAKALCPEPMNKIACHMNKLGLKPLRITTYRNAIEEGWAPAPSNDVQRAVWRELKK
jgi:hypothetical protein